MSAPARKSLVLGVVVAAIAGLCLYSIRRVDADLFGYLSYGRLFVQQGTPRTVDPFAYTSMGTPWVAFEYVAQIALWRAYSIGGPAGLLLLKGLLGGLTLYALARAVRISGDDAGLWLPAFIIGATTTSRYFLFRPQLFTFACFAVFSLVVLRYLVRGRAPLWLLPGVMLLWTNAHGGFLAGLGAVGMGWLLSLGRASSATTSGGDRQVARSLAVAFVACLAMTFANPWGAGLWRYVLTELMHGTNRRYIAEWRPVWSGDDPWSATVLLFVSVVLAAMTWAVAHERTRIAGTAAWAWALSAVPLLVLSALSVRHIPLAMLWAVPVMVLLVNSLTSRASLVNAFVLILGCGAFVFLVPTVRYVIQHPRPTIDNGTNLLGFTNPCRVVGVMRANHLTGHVYNPLSWGSYLTWETYPAIRVSMDGRNISAFPRDAVEENLRFYSSSPTASDADAPVNVASDYLLVPATVPMATTMRADVRWQVIYEDSEALLFARAEKAAPPLSVPAPPCPAVLH